jgi:hypothetical protein
MRRYPLCKAVAIGSLTPSGSYVNVIIFRSFPTLRIVFSLFSYLFATQISTTVLFNFLFLLIQFFCNIRTLSRRILLKLSRRILLKLSFSILYSTTKDSRFHKLGNTQLQCCRIFNMLN